jgi:hypothetical protein
MKLWKRAHCDGQRYGQRQARAVVAKKLKPAFACPLHLKLDGVSEATPFAVLIVVTAVAPTLICEDDDLGSP